MLIPDFQGSAPALETVLQARPDVLNHNIETVPRLYGPVRPGSRYARSLELFRRASAHATEPVTKSGMMLGLGEEADEVRATMADLRAAGVQLLTLGQYLRPSPLHLPVVRYVPPAEFEAFAADGRALGFRHVEAGPLVRSSYHAKRQVEAACSPPASRVMQYVPILMVFAISLGVACLLAYLPALLGPRRPTPVKMETFECGKDVLAAAGGAVRDQVLDHGDLLHHLRHRADVRLPVDRGVPEPRALRVRDHGRVPGDPHAGPVLRLAQRRTPVGVADFFTTKLDAALGWARKYSIFQYPFVTACCGMEYMATACSHYDVDRFGAGLPRFSPRQADVLFVVGTISHKMAPVLRRVYDQMTEPKWVVAFGVCTCTGGFYDNYATVQGIDTILPVDVYIPGCPPRPESVLDGLMKLQDKIAVGRQRY